MSWLSDKHSCFVFGRSQVQIMALGLAVLVVFPGFPKHPLENSGIVSYN
jgi:hypothetical protein